MLWHWPKLTLKWNSHKNLIWLLFYMNKINRTQFMSWKGWFCILAMPKQAIIEVWLKKRTFGIFSMIKVWGNYFYLVNIMCKILKETVLAGIIPRDKIGKIGKIKILPMPIFLFMRNRQKTQLNWYFKTKFKCKTPK